MSLLNEFTDLLSQIEIFELSESVNAWGQSEPDYPATATRTVLGLIQPRTGRESIAYGGLFPESTHILYTAGVLLSTDRVRYNGVDYAVKFVQTNGIGGIDDHSEILLEVIR